MNELLDAKDQEIADLNLALANLENKHQEVAAALKERIAEKNNMFQENWDLKSKVEELEAKLAKYEPKKEEPKKEEPKKEVKKEEPRGWFSSKKPSEEENKTTAASTGGWFSSAKKPIVASERKETPAAVESKTPPAEEKKAWPSFFTSVIQKMDREPKGK